jgi:plasmid replication initiation protein
VLQKDRHPNLDFFIADLSLWTMKDDQASMEHPFFSLSKSPDKNARHYEHNGSKITVAPNALYGMPTIWDKDILIYCCSQLIEGMQQDREPNKVIRLTAYDFLVSTNRSTSARGYDLMRQALDRLSGVRIKTNIKTGDVEEEKNFGLIDRWEAIRRLNGDSRMVNVEIVLSDWLYRAITNFEVLTLHRDYFRLDGGIERRMYELCRKHCGHQDTWSIYIPLLYKKSGAISPVKRFRQLIKQLTQSDHLPEYWLRYTQSSDKLTVYPRTHKGGLRQLKDILGVKAL